MSRRFIIALHDLCMVAIAWGLAYLIRYNFAMPPDAVVSLLAGLPVVVIAQGIILRITGLYRGLWRFASIPDFWNITRAVVLGSLVAGVSLFLLNRLHGVPRSTLILYPLLLTFLLSAPRLVYRMWKEHGLRLYDVGGRKRALILGAGASGEMLARDMLRDTGYLPVGFLDDNPRLRRGKVRGISILGTIDALPSVAEDFAPEVLIIAMPSANNDQMRRVVEICDRSGIPFRTLPRMQDLVSGRASLSELRNVAIEDLLGREPVALDWQSISQGLAGKTVLVTGGGGSIGSELCRQIARLGPASLVLLEHSEFNLYNIEMELRSKHPQLKLNACLGNVCDEVSVDHVMSVYHPRWSFTPPPTSTCRYSRGRPARRCSTTYSAPATWRGARTHGCGTFVLISTDKAVKPDQRHGRQQAHRGALLPGHERTISDTLYHRAVRQCHGLGGQRDTAVSEAD